MLEPRYLILYMKLTLVWFFSKKKKKKKTLVLSVLIHKIIFLTHQINLRFVSIK